MLHIVNIVNAIAANGLDAKNSDLDLHMLFHDKRKMNSSQHLKSTFQSNSRNPLGDSASKGKKKRRIDPLLWNRVDYIARNLRKRIFLSSLFPESRYI